jgi:hypothetical protein
MFHASHIIGYRHSSGTPQDMKIGERAVPVGIFKLNHWSPDVTAVLPHLIGSACAEAPSESVHSAAVILNILARQ